jgi:PAS domain S-box-containing protein
LAAPNVDDPAVSHVALPARAEPFLAALVRSSDDAIIGNTPDGQVVFWNVAAERLYGYEATEMLGRDIAVLVPPRPSLTNLRIYWPELEGVRL